MGCILFGVVLTIKGVYFALLHFTKGIYEGALGLGLLPVHSDHAKAIPMLQERSNHVAEDREEGG
jgi:hypothetical protein